jgi:hypothetical protein
MTDAGRTAIRIILALLGIFFGWLISSGAYNNFISSGVTPNFAAGYSVGIFALVLGAFGLVAVKVNL